MTQLSMDKVFIFNLIEIEKQVNEIYEDCSGFTQFQFFLFLIFVKYLNSIKASNDCERSHLSLLINHAGELFYCNSLFRNKQN
jgi:hypothetical protein